MVSQPQKSRAGEEGRKVPMLGNVVKPEEMGSGGARVGNSLPSTQRSGELLTQHTVEEAGGWERRVSVVCGS